MTDRVRILTVFGTRPEAIKMAPVVKALRADRRFDPKVCVSGQHRQMLDQALSLFDIQPEFDLEIMRAGQSLADIASRTMTGIAGVLARSPADFLLVQGDTTTAMAAALAGFYSRVKVGHVEAGLRTNNLDAPWPEEANRRVISVVTHHHFTPTAAAKQNLVQEGVSDSRVHVTGNTVIDALLDVVDRIETDPALRERCQRGMPAGVDPGKRLILVTGHRRENFGVGLDQVFSAVAELAGRKDVQVLYPVHMNPNVRDVAYLRLSEIPNVFLTAPLDYPTFVYAMTRSYFIITDSGGIQEEAPALGKPLLITREATERPEAVLGGTGILVGTDADRIKREATRLLDDPATYAAMSRKHNAFGDGRAAHHILEVLGRG